jgi:hypothetical protein
MKSLEISFRPLMISAVLLLLVVGLAPQSLLAQTVSASPVALSFGVPTVVPAPAGPYNAGNPAPASAAESLTVNIADPTGGQVTFGTTTVTGPNQVDFTVAGDSCTGQTFTAAATCQVAVIFNASLAPATTLETATLTLSITSEGATAPPPVPLSGAYGAIKLFGPLNINPSLFSYITWTQIPPTGGQTVRGDSVNISCPAGATAALSSTPDGKSNVFQDNTIQFADTVGVTTTTTANVCTGGDPQFDGFTGFPAGSTNCFQPSYESAAASYLLPTGVGQNPDVAVYPIGTGQPGSFIATFGVAPLNISTLLTSGTESSTQLQSVSVQEQDAGGDLGSATLFLATNCSPGGIVPGGSTTGNPTPTNTVTFDSNPGTDLSITDNTAQNPAPTGTTPIYTQIAVPQQLFYQLVQGTSAAPDVCLRASSEQDPANNNAPMCVGILIQCYNPSTGTTSGNNCDSSNPVGLRDLYDTVQFASPDAPVNGFNFLYGPGGSLEADACSYYLANQNGSGPGGVSGGACATGTGPGVVMGGDTWLCAPGSTIPPNAPGGCTPLEPNSSTPLFNTTTNPLTSPGNSIYSEANDALSGGLAGNVSPLDGLTQFLGAADGSGGSSVPLKNSVFFLVANHPLPTATATIAGQNSNGWINSTSAGTINATFNSAAASYTPGAANPPSNTFVAAPPYSLTYGISTYPALPDTTYPVTEDFTNYNANVNQNLGLNPTPPPSWLPLCSFAPSPATPASFQSTGSFSSLSNGIYNVHYFTTDCALTEGLVFNPTGTQLTTPTANWASFPFVTVGVDTSAPTLACSTSPAAVYGLWYNTNVTVSCSATDVGSGFAPGTAILNAGNTVLQGPLTTSFNTSTTVASGTINPAAGVVCASCTPSTPSGDLQISDLAGNPSNTQGPYSFEIDLQVPVISGPTLAPTASGNKYVVGAVSAVTITYSCNDGVGSGVAYCTEVGALPLGTTTICTPTPAGSGVPVTCTSTFTPAPTNVGSYSIYVGSADNVANIAANTAALNFSVADAPSTVIFGAFPAPAVTPGSNLTYYVGAADTDLPKTVSIYGATINVALKIPSGTLATGTATAISDDVTCTSWPCSVMPTTGPACTVTPSSVTSTTTAVSVSCSVGTIPDIFTSKTAAIVKIVLPTSKTAKAGSVATSGTITAVTPLSGVTSFSSSVSIK